MCVDVVGILFCFFLVLLGLPDVSCCPPACGGPFGACCCCCCAIKLYVKASEAAKLKMDFCFWFYTDRMRVSEQRERECVWVCV